MLTRWISYFALFLLIAAPIAAQKAPDLSLSKEKRARASELLKEYKTLTDYGKRFEVLEQLFELDRTVAKTMWGMIDREWRQEWPLYQKSFSEEAKAVAKIKDVPEKRKRIDELSTTVRSLRDRGNLTKEMVHAEGDPAIKELKELRGVTAGEILKSSETLTAAHVRIFALAREYNACIEELLLIDDQPIDEKEVLIGFENNAATQALPADKDAMRVLEQNEKLKDKVLPEEAEGIRDLNALRMLIGLRPVLIDPKLCEAGRGHSQDMKEKSFFAHDSPVSGKETPWKRASLAGTSANAENIYMGSPSPIEANKAWWYSPGHHKNMLAPGHKRGGMGHFEAHWTQMFGG
jgi:uncharacterized protein YkwD